MMVKISRRDFARKSLVGTAGLAALGSIEVAAASPAAIEAPKGADAFGPDEITVLLRNWFVNRDPVLARFPWIPVDESEFRMYTHRYATQSDLEELKQRGYATTGLISIAGQRKQYCQEMCFPVPERDGLAARKLMLKSDGVASPFDFGKTVQFQNLVDDAEQSIYYGMGGPDRTDKMKGLRTLLETNRVTAPAGLAGYDLDRFIMETLHKCRQSGGEPDVMLVASNMLQVFEDWGHKPRSIDAGRTVFGTPIGTHEIDCLHGVAIIEAPLLRSFTAVTLTSSEVYVRNKISPSWRTPSAAKGCCGDWVASMAIEVVNEHHSGWLEAA